MQGKAVNDMAEYYVVRDKNTGLYFRGKGVNRWGKYYNQASIYRIKANAENSIKEVSWRGEQAEVVPIQIIEGNADVVEVVRCCDCKYCETVIHSIIDEPKWFCTRMVRAFDVDPTCFCSYGERKE
jgi:hypothetical protein